MAQTSMLHELKLIRKRLESIEEALGEEMSAADRRAFKEGIREHKQKKTIPFSRLRAD